MSLEQSTQNLADAINALAEAIRFNAGITGTSAAVTALAAAASVPDEPKRGPGRPKKSPEPAAAPISTADEAAVSSPAPVPPPPVAEAAPTPATVDRSTVQKALVDVVVKVGKKECTDLCMKYGAPNLSALPESCWPALLADARKAVADKAA